MARSGVLNLGGVMETFMKKKKSHLQITNPYGMLSAPIGLRPYNPS